MAKYFVDFTVVTRLTAHIEVKDSDDVEKNVRDNWTLLEHESETTEFAFHSIAPVTAAIVRSEIEIIRVGEDPFGRNEATVYYRSSASDQDELYCWVRLWNEADAPLPAGWREQYEADLAAREKRRNKNL